MFALRSLSAAALVALAIVLPATAAETSALKSVDRGVTVTVIPINLGTGDTWDFKVVLDTHSQDLGDDLTKSVALVDPAGNRYMPIAWEGAAPGGHHREGVLRFAAIKPPAAFIELQLRRPDESAPRLFRWQLP